MSAAKVFASLRFSAVLSKESSRRARSRTSVLISLRFIVRVLRNPGQIQLLQTKDLPEPHAHLFSEISVRSHPSALLRSVGV
jgi:hypothetical protein